MPLGVVPSLTTKPKLACAEPPLTLAVSAGSESRSPVGENTGSSMVPPPVTFPGVEAAQTLVTVRHCLASSPTGRFTEAGLSGKHAWIVSVPGVPLLA